METRKVDPNLMVLAPKHCVVIVIDSVVYTDSGLHYVLINVAVPGKPTPSARHYPQQVETRSRTLTVLLPDESYIATSVGPLASSRQKITNQGGVAKVERVGLSRLLGPGTVYVRPVK